VVESFVVGLQTDVNGIQAIQAFNENKLFATDYQILDLLIYNPEGIKF
jgi:hypothetical protein